MNDILNRAGITEQESRVYLALLEIPESQTGQLCKRTKIASSNIYKVLDSLLEKGLASYRLQNNTKVFMATSPEALQELLNRKRRQLKEDEIQLANFIKTLKEKKPIDEIKSTYKYFIGLAGIKSMWNEINNTISSSAEMRVYTGNKKSYELMAGFFNKHHKARTKKKVKEKLLFPKEDKLLATKRKKQLAEVRFLDMKNEAEWGVWNDLFYLHYYPVRRKPKGFLIKDKIFSETFRQVFDQLWKNAEK